MNAEIMTISFRPVSFEIIHALYFFFDIRKRYNLSEYSSVRRIKHGRETIRKVKKTSGRDSRLDANCITTEPVVIRHSA